MNREMRQVGERKRQAQKKMRQAGIRSRQARQSDEDMQNIGEMMQAGQRYKSTQKRGMPAGRGLEGRGRESGGYGRN